MAGWLEKDSSPEATHARQAAHNDFQPTRNTMPMLNKPGRTIEHKEAELLGEKVGKVQVG